mmetsp:Transcript_26645/g.62584  ORF Transcript_26645/g.62584 Transcript_26645/m.62584 type:complete len:255 (+) Transcript_26645:555-1319(+)
MVVVGDDDAVSFGGAVLAASGSTPVEKPVSIASPPLAVDSAAGTHPAGGCAGKATGTAGRTGAGTAGFPIFGSESVSVDTAEASALKLRGMGRGGRAMAAADVKRSVSFWIMVRSRACWSWIRRRTTSSRPGLSLECFDLGGLWTAVLAGSLRGLSAPLVAFALLLPGIDLDFGFVPLVVGFGGLPVFGTTEPVVPTAAGGGWYPFPWISLVRGAMFTTVSCSCCCVAPFSIRKLLLALVALRCSALVQRLRRE